PDNVDQYVTGEASVFRGSGGSNTVFYIARENGRVGDMYGTGFVQVDGQNLFGANGLPVQDGTLRLLGNYNPDFSMGFNNQFTYKGLSMTVLVDWRKGGTFVSRTKALGSTSGVLEETLVGRETGVIGEGVMNVGTATEPVYVPNTTVVPASQFYNNFFDRGNEASALYDASYVKLRQVSFYYRIPKESTMKIGFENISIGLVGSNLLLFTENPHVDPELNAFQGRNITYGVEDMSYPSTRSFGVSLKTQF
ncbi:MAG: SusC/RagA family TonB-linked outer membrane protein, partial [Bacteroidia bacterium]|nr:SusC/RagA family TonB-linked outer membrane protein [Bacteroidia bacterium]